MEIIPSFAWPLRLIHSWFVSYSFSCAFPRGIFSREFIVEISWSLWRRLNYSLPSLHVCSCPLEKFPRKISVNPCVIVLAVDAWPFSFLTQEADKIALAESTGLDQKQINNWFINQRKRHWKPSENMQFAVMDSLSAPFYDEDWGWHPLHSMYIISVLLLKLIECNPMHSLIFVCFLCRENGLMDGLHGSRNLLCTPVACMIAPRRRQKSSLWKCMVALFIHNLTAHDCALSDSTVPGQCKEIWIRPARGLSDWVSKKWLNEVLKSTLPIAGVHKAVDLIY